MACIIGKHCREHDMVHGAEAEELRKGLELLIRDGDVREAAVQNLLDNVDARDSLSFVEMVEREAKKKPTKRARKGKRRD